MKLPFTRSRPSAAPQTAPVGIAERFVCDTETLAGIELPLGAKPAGAGQIDVLIRHPGQDVTRHVSWSLDRNARDGGLTNPLPVSFAPLKGTKGAVLDIAVAFDAQSASAEAIWAEFARMTAGTRDPISIPCIAMATAPDAVVVSVGRFWCDKNGLFVEGEIRRAVTEGLEAQLVAGEDSARLQVSQTAPGLARFSGYLPWRAGTPIWILLSDGRETSSLPLTLPRGELEVTRWSGRDEWDKTLTDAMGQDQADESQAALSFKHFVRSADAPEMTVVEVGGRVVGDASQAMRRFMPQARRFISVDIHASEHVDVVGDAHYLDELLGAESVDAVFSLSVMEHLAYPWLFAAAVNRALKPGGIVFQSTPHTWPLHETPNDFWRFSDEALKILFGPETGFEVIDAGMVNRIWLYPEERRGAFVDMPFNHGYGNAYIYARKIGSVDSESVRWPVNRSASDAVARQYPQADRRSRGLGSAQD